MPEWLAIVIAVAAPLATFVGVVWSRAKTETRIVGRIDLLAAKLDATAAANNIRFDAVDKELVAAKDSRIHLRNEVQSQDKRLDSLITACAMTHADRKLPETVR